MTVGDATYLRASARFNSLNGQDNVNVYWFRTSFGTPQSDADVITGVDTYLTSVYAEFDQDLRSGYTPKDLKIDEVEFLGNKWVVTRNLYFGSWGAGITASGGSDNLPEGVSVVGFQYTGVGKHTGRKFFGGFTEAASDTGGNLIAATAARVLAGLVKLATDYVISAGNNLQTKIADQVTGQLRQMTEAAVSGTFGYQRRRKPGVGS